MRHFSAIFFLLYLHPNLFPCNIWKKHFVFFTNLCERDFLDGGNYDNDFFCDGTHKNVLMLSKIITKMESFEHRKRQLSQCQDNSKCLGKKTFSFSWLGNSNLNTFWGRIKNMFFYATLWNLVFLISVQDPLSIISPVKLSRKELTSI